MSVFSVRTTTPVDEASAIATVVLAFSTDPVARWCWPDPHQYVENMPGFIRAFAGGAFKHNGALCSDDHAGAALWLPPNVHSDEEALGDILQRTLTEGVRGDLSAVFEQLAGYHPVVPRWYLPMIGVDTVHQGKGYGSALMKYALERCDREHLPAYLESTNPKNISLYQRHGFEALATVQEGTSPPFVPMARERR
ncbi:MAG: GNAT family N-acetyltransferase [Blastocatellia bacterium]